MSDAVVVADNLSKRYRLSLAQNRPDNVRELIAATLRSPFGYLRERLRAPTEEESLWALRGVSFEVQRGEVLGFIGRNGAGKSTLLKILSRITDPTEGKAVIRGRVGSLLEVGTGFHPDLTGRENVYLNGAILGMRRREIDAKFDEIVDFANVGRFIDTPVKRYSSGMHVRLAFAVAAHLEPEILIVDEVLAVGDAAFQRKSLGRMEALAGHGRTVLFVSHNMASIQTLCQRALLLDSGQVVMSGEPSAVIEHYLQTVDADQSAGSLDLRRHPNRAPNTEPVFEHLRLLDCHGQPKAAFQMGEPITFELDLNLDDLCLESPALVLTIEARGTLICTLRSPFMHPQPFKLQGHQRVRCTWDPGWLAPGLYTLARLVVRKQKEARPLDLIEQVLIFEVLGRDAYGAGAPSADLGVLVPKGRWAFEPLLEPAESAA